MSKKQVIALWIIAAVLIGTLAIVKSTQSDDFDSATARDRGETLLDEFPADKVAEMKISQGEDQVTLRQKDGSWTVVERDDYPANVGNVNDLLRTVAEVKVTQGIEADPSFAPRFGMDPEADEKEDQGTDLFLSDASGNELAHLTFGKELESASNPMSPFGGGGATGRFVMNHADTSGVYVTSEIFPTLTVMVERWLDDSFLKVERIQSIAVSEPGKENETAWKVSREDENGSFTLEGKKSNEELDSTALDPMKNLFSYARFEDVIPAEEAAKQWIKDKRQTAVIETFEGMTYHITFGPIAAPEAASETPAADNFAMTVTVTGEVPAERKKPEGESEEDAKKADEAFATRKKELEENLAKTRKLEGRVFKVTKYTLESLLKDRTGLIKSAPPTPPAAPAATGATTPPVGNRPMQAVTPPIQIPPAPPREEE